jgi:hypothetical protein
MIRGLKRVLSPQEEEARAHPRAAPVVHVDALLRVDDRAFLVEGWVRHEFGRIVRLTAWSPAGDRVELADRSHRFDRPDVVEERGGFPGATTFGFLCYFELSDPIGSTGPWRIDTADDAGAIATFEAPVATHPDQVLDRVFSMVANDRLFGPGLMNHHILPAVERLSRPYAAAAPAFESRFGPVPDDPWISVVVPVAEPGERLEVQMSQFADVDGFTATDLVYVLDRPELAEGVLPTAPHLFDVYGVPFRVIVPDRRAGYAGATNVGVGHARGPLVLRLHSDVLPGNHAWLDDLHTSWEATEDPGALGPKLLFEDGTIEQAGVSLSRDAHTGLWQGIELHRGLHGRWPAANVARTVPGVGGACMLLTRASFDHAGGLSGAYLQPLAEDIDLCLRMAARSSAICYTPDVEAYHLQEMQRGSHRTKARARYDSFLLSERWGSSVARKLQDETEDPDPHAKGHSWAP